MTPFQTWSNTLNKPFCLYITNQARFSADTYAPCCWITRRLNLITATQQETNEYKNWLSNINDWVPECNFCQEKELRNIDSPRIEIEKNPTKVGITNESDIGSITSLDLQIDLSCNAACLMCSSYNSTTWKKYELGSIDNKSQVNKNIDSENTYRTQQRLKNVFASIALDRVNHIMFLGGEPLDSDIHKQTLLEIQKHKPLSTVEVRYTTNGSRLPDAETVELWKQLKSLTVIFSLDGTEQHFNYLRWPLQWHQVDHNVRQFVKLKSSDLPGINFGISSAISPFNIFYYDHYLDWEADAFRQLPYPKRPRFSTAFDATGVINTACIPPDLMTVIQEKYQDRPWLVNRMRPFDPARYTKFMQYVEQHDQLRGTNWRETFPEVVRYFDLDI